MKRILAVLLAVMMMVLTACSETEPKNKKETEAYELLKSTQINFDNDERLLDIFIFLALNRADFDASDKAYEKLKLISPDCETVRDYNNERNRRSSEQ